MEEANKQHIIGEVLLPGVRAVVLDLDGTLYPRRGFIGRLIWSQRWHLPLLIAERLTRRSLKGRYLGEDYTDTFFRRAAWLWSAGYIRRWYTGFYMPSMVRILRDHYEARVWVLPLLMRCREQGIKVAVYSDYDAVSDKLSALGLDPGLFDVLASASELGGQKPSRESSMRVLERLGAEPETTVFVGDRRGTDGRAAALAGCPFYYVEQE